MCYGISWEPRDMIMILPLTYTLDNSYVIVTGGGNSGGSWSYSTKIDNGSFHLGNRGTVRFGSPTYYLTCGY